jgi:hypothetical protein
MFRDDWMKWGFGDGMLAHSVNEPFVIDYSAAQHLDNRTGLEYAIEAAQHIYESMPQPLTLMVSGGVDSQAMAYAFKRSGVPFRAVSAIYNDGLNEHDLRTRSFYRSHDIEVEELPIDIIAFHRGEMFEWAEKYQNNSPHLLSHMLIASKLPGTVVSSGCVVRRPNIGPMNYSVFGLERYSRISGQPMIGYFFNYDPRLLRSCYEVAIPPADPTKDVTDAAYDRKVAIYRAAGFPVERQHAKLHGFERLKEHFDSTPVSVQTRLRYKEKDSSRPYDLLFRYPLEALVPYDGRSITIYPGR